MMVAKIFENGRSQAVRLPKEFRFKEKEVMISKVNDIVMLIPKKKQWDVFFKAIDSFSDDYMKGGRGKIGEQKREKL